MWLYCFFSWAHQLCWLLSINNEMSVLYGVARLKIAHSLPFNNNDMWPYFVTIRQSKSFIVAKPQLLAFFCEFMFFFFYNPTQWLLIFFHVENPTFILFWYIFQVLNYQAIAMLNRYAQFQKRTHMLPWK